MWLFDFQKIVLSSTCKGNSKEGDFSCDQSFFWIFFVLGRSIFWNSKNHMKKCISRKCVSAWNNAVTHFNNFHKSHMCDLMHSSWSHFFSFCCLAAVLSFFHSRQRHSHVFPPKTFAVKFVCSQSKKQECFAISWKSRAAGLKKC